MEPQAVKEETKELMEESDEETMERACVIEYKKHLEVIHYNKNLTLAGLKILIRERIKECPNQFDLMYHSQVILNDTVMLQTLRDGVLFTIIPYQSLSKVVSTSTAITRYIPRSPSLNDASLKITPSLDSLSHLLNCELEAVPNFTVERKGLGKIQWLEPVDLRDVAIDQVISIEKDSNGMPSISVRFG